MVVLSPALDGAMNEKGEQRCWLRGSGGLLHPTPIEEGHHAIDDRFHAEGLRIRESKSPGVRGEYDHDGRGCRRGLLSAAPSLAAESSPRITPVSVNHIAITVSDLGQAKQWYTGLLNLKVVQETPRLVLLRFADTELVLRPGAHPGTITHFMFGIQPYDEAALKATLQAHGLDPRKDLDSFLVKGPDDLTVQIGDRQMGLKSGYPPANS
jgi:catechol 2,3-dioxygenase-like lactoylglutathione lyase family enzyme